MGARGPASALTPLLSACLIADLRSGLYANQAALRNGIHPRTLVNWVAKGLAENAAEPYLSFAKEYTLACVDVERRVLKQVLTGARRRRTRKVVHKKITGQPGSPDFVEETESEQDEGGDWRAGAWFLERRYPQRWGRGRDNAPQDQEAPEVILEAATSRDEDVRELLENPPPELEEALLEKKDAILALFAEAARRPR